MTNNNYQHSVDLLKDCYGQPHKLISTHIQALLDIPKPVNKHASLVSFHDTIEGHIHCLQSLGKSPDSLEMLLVPIMLGKLPEETKKNVARARDSSEWKVEQLQTALLREIRIFETSNSESKKGYQRPPSLHHQASSLVTNLKTIQVSSQFAQTIREATIQIIVKFTRINSHAWQLSNKRSFVITVLCIIVFPNVHPGIDADSAMVNIIQVYAILPPLGPSLLALPPPIILPQMRPLLNQLPTQPRIQLLLL